MQGSQRKLIAGCVAIGLVAGLGLILWPVIEKPAGKTAPAASAASAAPTAAPTAAPAKPAKPNALAVLDPQVHSVVSFIGANCLECHNTEDHLGDLVLETYKDAQSIRKNRKQWNKLLTLVQGGAMPPVEAQKHPEKADREKFVSMVKEVLAYTDPAHPDPGHVTMRRLNRNEYDNSVYGLTGINFYPSAEFPPDDVSGGYDNNGEGLILSPLLMERYLVASDAIMQQVLPEPGYWPLVKKIEQFQTTANSYRQTSLGRTGIKHILPGGSITANNPVPAEGEYMFKSFAYWHKDKDQPLGTAVPTMNIMVDGEQAATFQVDAIGYEGSIFYDSPPIHLKAGQHQFVITWPLKDGETAPTLQSVGATAAAGKDEPLGLFVRWGELNGPFTTVTPLMKHKDGEEPRAAAREVIERMASQAYRRPATTEDVDKLMSFYDQTPGVDKLTAAYATPTNKEALVWYQAVRPAIQAILVSPSFLFKVEEDDHPEATGPHAITDFQLATRLSYFLWSSPPDDDLLALAAKNDLHNHMEDQVRRMLKDSRADALTANFAEQWLHLRMLKKVTPDREKFPQYTDDLRDAMRIETLTFFNHIVTEDRSVLDLIDGNFTYINQPLAQLYGIVDTKGNIQGQENPLPGGTPIRGANFVKVDLQGNQRAGVLTQASLLTITSNPGRTSPVKRGKFVLEQFLGEPPPPPPPNVPALEVTAKAPGGNLRQRMEEHRANPACAACHLQMDAIGFSFENFNAVGGFRDKDEDAPVDPSGTLEDGTKFSGPIGLEKVLKDKSDVFTSCLAEQLMTYGLGRQMQYYDQPAVDKIVKATAADGYKFSRLVVEIVNSDPFRMRRGKDQTDE